MSKVFVVTQGEYSNYHIVGVFSSRENAERQCPTVNGERKEACIEEYDLDMLENNELLQDVFTVYLDVETGEWDGSYCKTELKPRDFTEVADFNTWNYTIKAERPTVVAESVVSKEHAEKLAIEHRQKLLRERQ